MMLQKSDPPYHWEKYNLTVTVDGYLANGTRVHLVAENIIPQVIANAVVMEDKDYFSGRPLADIKRKIHFLLEEVT